MGQIVEAESEGTFKTESVDSFSSPGHNHTMQSQLDNGSLNNISNKPGFP